MASQLHTYGPTCLLYDPACEQSTTSQDPNEITPPPPKIRAQFFYVSPLPIDDPLTPSAAPSAGSTFSQAKLPPRPFSVRDNIALEEAWQGLGDTVEDLAAGKTGGGGGGGHDGPPSRPGSHASRVRGSRRKKYGDGDGDGDGGSPSVGEPGTASRSQPLQRVSQLQRVPNDYTPAMERGGLVDNNPRKRQGIPIPRRSKSPKQYHDSPLSKEQPQEEGQGEGERLTGSGSSTPRTGRRSVDLNVSGSPFARAPVRHRAKPQYESEMSKSPMPGTTLPGQAIPRGMSFDEAQAGGESADASAARSRSSSVEGEIESTVTVGASRLHEVELPKLQMRPIYWNPVQDIAPVMRATWFYKDTMLPIEPSLANQLEAGYMYLKPWTETWQDELNSCVDNGAEAELKIVHKTWPKEEPGDAQENIQAPDQVPSSGSAETGSKTQQKSRDFGENQAAGSMETQQDSYKQFKNSSVIYVNSKDAQILRPSLLPSVSRGRRPLSSIRKGRQIGIAVVRGFNRQVWDKVHPTKLPSTIPRNLAKMHQKESVGAGPRRQICYACQMEDTKPAVSDLVLVIHGIGQKLSERVESFHFTHSINAFRRQVDLELNSDSIAPHLRPGMESIMVLPVNWRSNLSLEEPEVEESLSKDPNENHFGLKDITPGTIPAIRNLISDVMLDIPYYLSHHKEKMIKAVVKEANRIFRLWCHNNPGFRENGRVHLIAHSLGSIMAMDILSQQPTRPLSVDFSNAEISQTMFEFDTKNVFFCGSPAGFFLLLNKASLLPRKGRQKPGWENEDAARGIAGEAGTYGCMAIDNLYNVMHETDPIAYHLNAAVDTDLANSLRPASVPTSSATFLQSVGNVFRWSSTNTQFASSPANRPALTAKLPSNIELETHDFTREETAETRMALMNDNGQIDFSISGGGGPLNIQYLNMLSAHSSYWILPDFVRFLVVEIGRRQGRQGQLLALRAEKKKGWKRRG